MKKALLIRAIKASIEAGEEILKIYNQNFKIDYKDDQSPLTEADIVSNNKIISCLEPTGIPIISEETIALDYSVRKAWHRCWIVDPLDGTKEFIKRNGEFTVNIAMVEHGVPLFGVIYAPALHELYYTDVDKTQAYKSTIHTAENLDEMLFKEHDRIYPSKHSEEAVNIIASRSHLNDYTVNFINDLKSKYPTVTIVSKGSSLKFCLLAEGKADVYPRFAPTMEWDTAAGQAICEAVGLQVIDITTHKRMSYNRADLLNNHFLVTKDAIELL